TARTRSAGGAGAGAGRRARTQGRIADRLGRTGGTLGALAAAFTRRRFGGLRTLAAHGLFAGRAAAEGGTFKRRAALRNLGRALAEVDGGALGSRGRGRLHRFGLGLDLGGLDLGGLNLGSHSLGRFDLGRSGLVRRGRGGAQLGGLDARGFSGGFGGGGVGGRSE